MTSAAAIAQPRLMIHSARAPLLAQPLDDFRAVASTSSRAAAALPSRFPDPRS